MQVSPDVLSQLFGGAGAGAADPSMTGGPPQMGGASDPNAAPAQGGGPEDEPLALIKQMIDLAQQYIAAEPDAEDKATMAKLVATLHQYQAKDQKDAEAALGGGAATRALRKLSL